jgi:3-oxoacyl-[acyl-carrier-protein] synthase-3
MKFAKIHSTGSYLPENIVRNEDLEQFPAAALKLIEQKTGVRERRHAAEGQGTSDLAASAAARCMENSGIDPDELDAIILATSSPDSIQPATGARVQHLLGASNAYAFDINSVCSGSVFAFSMADSMIRSGRAEKVLVVASEVYSRILNREDFSTFPYFGDGAGAVLFVAADRPGIVNSVLHTDGSGADVIMVRAGGSMLPCRDAEEEKDLYFRMDGRKVYEFALEAGPEVVRELLEAEGLGPDDVARVFSHQANINILKELSSVLKIPFERFSLNLDRYGNTAAASTLIALDADMGDLGPGDRLVFVAFGGGLSWGANLIEL